MNEWYAANGCSHAHCPLDCEHPQPFLGPDGNAYCGHCFLVHGEVTPVVPCTQEVCE